MASEKTSAERAAAEDHGIGLIGWYVFAVLLVLGGLLLSARADDDYMGVSGLLFAAFGVLLGFRLLGRSLP
ncbi:hypothetical protein [Roseicella aquatilis]|uniref:Uncharacterized protein n=1 Tax=Roseicella aquatilis TaxID=2527868 RepID=A0A4R4DPX4_9PROT|nr:hypothetical protein [Roseicella aquatilis]TCZ63031.1 hypothetical protein EXY23_11720 [Roseicella aquatilis]